MSKTEEKIVTFETATHVLTQSLANYLNSYSEEIYFSDVALNTWGKDTIESLIKILREYQTLE